ncbi:MAG: head GIN domain-containing protein [Bacteroidota bacterium]
MKQLLILLLSVCGLSSIVNAQLEQTFALPTFNKIHYAGQGSIFLERGSASSARVEAASTDHLENVVVEVQDETLYIRYNLHSPDHPVFASPRLDVYLTYEQLDAITVSGKVRIDANEPIKTHQLDFHAEGFIDVNLALDVDHFHSFVEGNVSMTFSGKTQSQNIHLEGQGSINAFDLTSHETIATVNGTGSIYLYVKDSLEAIAGGLSKIVYKGNPVKKAFNKTGKVSIRQREI